MNREKIVTKEKDETVNASSCGYETPEKKREEYMSWKKFKNRYLSKVEYLAEILGLDRDEVIEKVEVSRRERHPEERITDDDWIFVDRVLTCINECEDEEERRRLIVKLKQSGSTDIFDEIYRIWAIGKYFFYCSGEEAYDQNKWHRAAKYSGDRKRNIFDILSLDYCEGPGFMYSLEEDDEFENNWWPIEIKIKHNTNMTAEMIVEALQVAVDYYRRYFTNSYSFESSEVYKDGWEKQSHAMQVGLLEGNQAIGRAYCWNDVSVAKAMKLLGWLDPEVSLDTGIGEMLQRGWPKLYEKVLEGKMSPFEALLETEWVHPKDLFDVLGNCKEVQSLVEEKFPPDKWIHRNQEVDEIIGGTIEAENDLLRHLEDL